MRKGHWCEVRGLGTVLGRATSSRNGASSAKHNTLAATNAVPPETSTRSAGTANGTTFTGTFRWFWFFVVLGNSPAKTWWHGKKTGSEQEFVKT
jgi:hypothetical protein